MKTPDASDLTTAHVALEHAARDARSEADAIGKAEAPGLYEALVARAEAIERVLPWLVELDVSQRKRAIRRCAQGKHRVREVAQRYADGITIERCRCGAERVRDGHTREVSDWADASRPPKGAMIPHKLGTDANGHDLYTLESAEALDARRIAYWADKEGLHVELARR